MADRFSKNPIYVETDYDNIILIDPNKIVVDNKIKDRLVQHEELVYYANLETRVIPRTKLAVGENNDNPVFNIGVASIKGKVSDPSSVINFLQPLNKTKFDTSWSDQLTGKGTRTASGLNQINESVKSVGGKQYFERSVTNYSDTQLLGITDISVTTEGYGITTVSVDLVDVQGRTLFEQGEKSIYSVFFNLPYPIFYLTLKGYYGKAIRYSLNLTKFNASFDQDSGNYNISLEFLGMQTGLLSDTILDYAKTAPKMFPTTILTEEQKPAGTNNKIVTTNSSIGRQKLEEVYKIYESKGLIPKGFPRLTIEEFIMRCDNFNTAMKDKIKKGDFAVLNDVQSYKDVVNELKETIYTKILDNYLDKSNFFIYNGKVFFTFQNSIDFNRREQLLNDIKIEIDGANENLQNNGTFGKNGSYTIGNQTINDLKINTKFSINDIVEDFDYTQLQENDYRISLESRLGRPATNEEIVIFKAQITKDFELFTKRINRATGQVENTLPKVFAYGEIKIGDDNYWTGSFLWKVNESLNLLKTKQTNIEETISQELAIELFDKGQGVLGFEPTIRNLYAIIMAGVDTFYRLLDRTHLDAWSKKNDPRRIKSILPPDKNFGIDSKNVVGYSNQLEERNYVYPWPTYFTLEKQDGNQVYTVQYLGDSKYSQQTDAFNQQVWPEVFFTEEYLNASTRKTPNTTVNNYNNPSEVTKYSSCNALDFPFSEDPYQNLAEINIFYEIYERLYLSSHYTKIFRGNYKTQQVEKFIADLEGNNLLNVCDGSPDLSQKLKNQRFNLQTLKNYITAISSGYDKYPLYLNEIFTTDSIKISLQKQFGLYSVDTIDASSIKVETSAPLVENFEDYLKSSETSKSVFLDTLPFTSNDWLLEKVGVTKEEFINTTKTILFLDEKKTLATLDENSQGEKLTFYYNYDYKGIFKNYNDPVYVTPATNTQISDRTTLKNYFEELTTVENKIVTVDEFSYDNYSGNVQSDQSTTILNTPVFMNALLDGIQKERNNEENPYVPLGLIYLSSFQQPILSSGLRNDKGELLAGIGAVISKYSSITKLPYNYVLYLGGTWHRYKKWVDSNFQTDILEDVWKNFDYEKYYDPTSVTPSLTKEYIVKNYTGGTFNIRAFNQVSSQPPYSFDVYNLGFYPKVINDLHWYVTKEDLFQSYNEVEFENAYTSGKLKIGTNPTASFVSMPGQTPSTPNKGYVVNSLFQYMVFDRSPFLDTNNKIYFPIPSMGGTPFNQSVFECFKETPKTQTIDLQNNPAVYNGSVRALWGQPNYGYFDLDNFTKPEPSQYLRTSKIELFSSLDKPYIEDFFSTFNPDMLDEFENAFLGFCNPTASINDILVLSGEKNNPSLTETNKIRDIKQRRLKDQILEIFKVKESSVTIINEQDQDALSISQSQTTNFVRSAEKFIKFNCVFKNGNPGNYDRRVFTNFSTDPAVSLLNPIVYEPYVYNSLPGSGQTQTYNTSFSLNTDAWKTLHKYVGFSTLPGVVYTNTGSTITDFFIDFNIQFTSENIASLYQIIKIYASEKHLTKNTPAQFLIKFNEYIQSQNVLMSEMTLEVFRYLNQNLPDVTQKNDPKSSNVQGNVTKLSVYNTFQAFNDKWIAGSDLSTRTIFESFLFHDSANSDIGDKFQIDVMEVANILKGDNNISILDVVGLINKRAEDLLFFAMPAYVNFYGNNTPSIKPEPKNIDVPNSLFGTYEEVNYLDSNQKFIVMYVGKQSEKPKSDGNQFVFYKDDSYDLRNPATNPVRRQTNQNYNFSLSNKLVAFNVDFGIRNQNMFTSIEVGMEDKKTTAATFLVNDQLANGVNGDKIAQQTTSLYSFYQSQSYGCSVTSLGNVMLQPLMYFNLKHVPLFYGPYLIMKVTHTISEDGFTTKVEGNRMPKYGLPQPDVLATYIKANYLEKYLPEILETKNPNSEFTEVVTNLDDPNQGPTISPETECQQQITYAPYQQLAYKDLIREPLTYSDFAFKVLEVTPTDYDRIIAITVFSIAATRTSNGFETNILQVVNNNPFELSPVNVYPPLPLFSGGVVCTTVREFVKPLFSFENVNDPIRFVYDEYKTRLPFLNQLKELNSGTEQEKYEKAITQLIFAGVDSTYLYNNPNTNLPATPLEVRDLTLFNLANDRILQATYDGYQGVVKIGFTLFQ